MSEAAEDYCRAIEAYLCRKNDGHLIRIVGPAFDQVCAWAARGVPITIACLGIDRYFERYYGRNRRRRPVRVEFCEADVLDAFDDWRRAVGVPAPPGAPAEAGDPPRRSGSLAAHLERVIARLTMLRSSVSPEMAALVAPVIHELDAARGAAPTARGEARQILLARLAELDAQVLQGVRACCDTEAAADLAAQADRELAPFRARMSAQEYALARERALDQLVRQRWGLPSLVLE
jgi:hypothetical protein